jgi:hypothetical protein
MGATEVVLSMQEGAIYDPGESLLPRLAFQRADHGQMIYFCPVPKFEPPSTRALASRMRA